MTPQGEPPGAGAPKLPPNPCPQTPPTKLGPSTKKPGFNPEGVGQETLQAQTPAASKPQAGSPGGDQQPAQSANGVDSGLRSRLSRRRCVMMRIRCRSGRGLVGYAEAASDTVAASFILRRRLLPYLWGSRVRVVRLTRLVGGANSEADDVFANYLVGAGGVVGGISDVRCTGLAAAGGVSQGCRWRGGSACWGTGGRWWSRERWCGGAVGGGGSRESWSCGAIGGAGAARAGIAKTSARMTAPVRSKSAVYGGERRFWVKRRRVFRPGGAAAGALLLLLQGRRRPMAMMPSACRVLPPQAAESSVAVVEKRRWPEYGNCSHRSGQHFGAGNNGSGDSGTRRPTTAAAARGRSALPRVWRGRPGMCWLLALLFRTAPAEACVAAGGVTGDELFAQAGEAAHWATAGPGGADSRRGISRSRGRCR